MKYAAITPFLSTLLLVTMLAGIADAERESPMNHIMIAQVDMRLNLAVATVILIVGACVVVALSRRKDGNGNKSRWWIPLASLVAGPLIAFGLWAADVFLFNPDMYPTAFEGDALATLSRTMISGSFVGVVASVVFAVALKARRCSRTDRNKAKIQPSENSIW